jgi:type II secretory pathway component PulF
MLYAYKALNKEGGSMEGTIDAVTVDVAISSLQRRGFVISSIEPVNLKKPFLQRKFSIFSGVKNKDIVILSRQMSILFEAQVSALRVFRLLSGEMENQLMREVLTQVADDLQAGSSISASLSKHPKVFSSFYVNMVKSGEESGKLDEIFIYLADYLDRTYEVTSKARGALIYPSFVMATFVAVMILMFTVVIPKIGAIIVESGQDIPLYTKVVMAISNFLVRYGIFVAIAAIISSFFLYRYSQTPTGKISFSKFKLSIPYLGMLYKKLYLSRISDNMNTMLISGIPMMRSLEITADVVDNAVYSDLLKESLEAVKAGTAVSEALSRYEEIPGIMIQMIKVGEETGQLGNILKTMAKFYRREVTNAVDTMVDLIEPVMIVTLGVGVGILLASVLVPIYNLSATF